MIKGRRLVVSPATVLSLAIALFISVMPTQNCSIAFALSGESKTLNAGDTWIVEETTRLSRLTVPRDAFIKAPDGYSLTMTIDGIGTAIKPGTYRGDVALTVTEEIKVQYFMLPEPHFFRAAVYIEDGKYIPGKSVAAAVVGGSVTDAAAKDIKITSKEENFNGIIVTGERASSYEIINPVIHFTGNGGNDFAGFGAAVN